MASLMDILAGAGNLLDLPGSSLRDLLSGRNPFDQWTTPFSDVNRASGRDVLQPFLGANEETGMAGWATNPMEGLKDIAGFGAEMLLDPLNLVPLGAVGKALKGRKAARQANAAMKAERGGKYAMVNPKVAGRVATEVAPDARVLSQLEMDRYNLLRKAREESPLVDSDISELGLDYPTTEGYGAQFNERSQQINTLRDQNPMKLLGYTPAPEDPMFPGVELMRHGGHDMSASATKQHPYGAFDLSRLKTGEGNNMYSPGAYKADAETTSAFYRDMVQDALDEKFYRSNEALAKYFEPGRTLFQGYGGNNVDRVLEFSPNSEGQNWSGWSVKVQSMKEGADGVYRAAGSPRWHATQPEMTDMRKFLGENPNKARLYTFDAPAGTKDRFIIWENPMSQQPSQVVDKFDQIMGAGSSEGISKLKEIRSFYQTLEDDLTEIRRTRRYGFADEADKARAMGMEAQVTALREQAASIQDDLIKAGVPRSLLAHDYLDDFDSGGGLIGFFMGKDPSQAAISDAKILADAGLPGVKNLANSTGRTSYNYAIWDQSLLNQMRVRMIDGQRVPINPTTLIEQVQQPVARAADSPLMSTMNPMQLQPETSPFPAAVAGAVYNALQAFNRHGGIQ